MPQLRLLLVRHGQSEANAERRMQGRLDSPLTARGRRQAEAIAKRIAAEGKVDKLYTSPLQRALQTAWIIGAKVSLEPVLLADLMEVDFGAAAGLSRQEFKQCWPQHARSLRRRNPDARWPGGESLRELAERAARVMEEIKSRHASGVVVVVSHHRILRWSIAHLLSGISQSHPDYSLDNCAITELVLGDGEPIIACSNDVSHLAEIAEEEARSV